MWFRGKRRVCGSGPKLEGVGQAGLTRREARGGGGPPPRTGKAQQPDPLTHVPKPEVEMFCGRSQLKYWLHFITFIEIIIKLGGKNARWLNSERLHKAARSLPRTPCHCSARGSGSRSQSRGAGDRGGRSTAAVDPRLPAPTFPFPSATRALPPRPQIPIGSIQPPTPRVWNFKAAGWQSQGVPPGERAGGLSPPPNPSPRAPAPHAAQKGHLRPATRFSSRSPRLCGHQPVPGSRHLPRMGLC